MVTSVQDIIAKIITPDLRALETESLCNGVVAKGVPAHANFTKLLSNLSERMSRHLPYAEMAEARMFIQPDHNYALRVTFQDAVVARCASECVRLALEDGPPLGRFTLKGRLEYFAIAPVTPRAHI